MTQSSGSETRAEVPAWDVSTRLFHWLLVALIVSAYVTRTYSDDPTLYLHRMNGYAIWVLLIFRLLWGLVGSSTALFAGFLPWPGPAWRYLIAMGRRQRMHFLGHNPLGGALILLMLLAVMAQATTGLFTTDDTLAQGPLYDHVSEAVSRSAGSYHAKGLWIIAALATVHILANLTYQFALREKLITAMLTGRKPAGRYVDQQQAQIAPAWRAVLCLGLSVALVGGGVIAANGSLLH
ncbi:MAG: cytochrome b/b6 domain-containing protein [Rhodospirillales bacterium]|nr:cytochrome b/b6 domain-containing protein [Acetobacter sp.]